MDSKQSIIKLSKLAKVRLIHLVLSTGKYSNHWKIEYILI